MAFDTSRLIPVLLLVAGVAPASGQSTPSTSPGSTGNTGFSSYSTFTGSASNASQSLGINFPGFGSSVGSSGGIVSPSPIAIGAVGGWAYYPVYQPQPIIQILPVPVAEQGRGGLMLPMPPRQLVEPAAARPRRANPARAREQLELGDRSFRGGNTKRAEERYVLASKADTAAPLPHVHLAQVSLVRKDYANAADRIRTAVASAQGSAWLANAPDIQAMYAEPGDFARHMARLESHLQTNPGDRDAWFVYGVEWYLSGRTQQAADAFQRLTDRRPDEALSAFLDAANLRRPPAN
jgi:hypothetical protein